MRRSTTSFFSDGSGNALDGGDEDLVVGMTTLDGEALYLWSFGDFAYAATRDGSGDPVKIVAVFSLKEASDHLTAQVQMVTTEPLLHTDSGDSDDGLDFTDVLNVSASGSLSFNFDGLPSGNFLYAAFGSDSAGLLITGADLNVKELGGRSQVGEVDGGGGKNGDPCGTLVNTSQGEVGTSATIGINSQHFVDGNNADGPTGVFTLVTGFVPLELEVPATGTNISEINYDGYINAFGAAFFISQSRKLAPPTSRCPCGEPAGRVEPLLKLSSTISATRRPTARSSMTTSCAARPWRVSEHCGLFRTAVGRPFVPDCRRHLLCQLCRRQRRWRDGHAAQHQRRQCVPARLHAQ